MKKHIYLDYNATAPIRPEAKAAMLECMEYPSNASSVHQYGQATKKIIEHARQNVANLIGATAEQIIFNSGATEANNTILKHFTGERILVSAIEHPSVIEVAPNADVIPVTPEGIIDLNALEGLLKQKPPPALVSIMMVNNETGAIQPIKEAVRLSKKYACLFHCDATQAAGKIPLNMYELGIDFLTLSSHKLGGPQGVGALAIGICGVTPALLHGGGQEKHLRAGTENVAGIAGFGASAEQAGKRLESYQRLEIFRDQIETHLLKTNPDTIIHAHGAPRICSATMFSTPDASSETLMMALDLEGIAVSNGSACSSGTVRANYVLQAMGITNEKASSALRISLGWDTKRTDIEHFMQAWTKIHERIKN